MVFPGNVYENWDGSEWVYLPYSVLLKMETVNTVPSLQGYAVQPNGKTATVKLQTSTDLNNWTPATNGIYPATNRAAFYRLDFQVN